MNTVAAQATSPTSLVCAGPAGTAQPGAGTTITATLRDAAGMALPDREIQWSDRPGLFFVVPAVSRTDAAGVASTRYIIPFDAGVEGEEVVTARFAGDATHRTASCEARFRVQSPGLPTPTPTPTATAIATTRPQQPVAPVVLPRTGARTESGGATAVGVVSGWAAGLLALGAAGLVGCRRCR